MHTALLLQVKNALLTLFRTHHTAGLHLLIDTFLTYNLSWEWKDAAKIQTTARCLKITEKVPFNIASEASYVYILSGQKLIKNAKMIHFGEFLKTWSLLSNNVTRHVIFKRTQIGGKCHDSKIQMRHFQTLCTRKNLGATLQQVHTYVPNPMVFNN